MRIDEFIKIMLVGASISLGAFLGVLRSKIFASKHSTKLHYFFYFLSILVALASILGLIGYWNELLHGETYFGLIVLASAFIFSIGLLVISKKYLLVKDIFTTAELDPIVNRFTSNADKSEIKLFGGDLNFLGEHPAQIDSHPQYTHLRSQNFRKVSILCEAPVTSIQKIRYGKILADIPSSELRFYHPDKADLKVRGRIIQVNGVNKLLMYSRVRSGVYQAIETDTANSNGALYNNIWELAWSLTDKPSKEEVEHYLALYKNE